QGATPSDQTDEFNSAIGAAAAAGGGIVVVPSGYYYFSSNDDIEVQENVTLRGVFSGPPKWNPSSIYNGDLQGTVLLCTRGRDTETPDIDTAFIRFIGPNSAVVGISIYYPEQEIFNDGDAKGISAVEISAASPVDELEFETSSPHTFVAGDVIEIIGIVTTPVEPNTFNGTYIVKEVADSTHFTVINYQNASDTYVSGGSAQKRSFHKYPWTIKGCEQCTIKDILLVNPYLGINLLGAGRHYLDGIFGTPLLTGISVDNCLDVGRIYRVHFHRVFWDGGTTPTGSLFNLLARAVGLELKRTDGQIVNDLFTFGYKTAIKLTAGDYGAGYGLLSNIYIDGSDLGIDIDTLQQNTGYYFSTLYVSVPWALRTDDGDTNWYAMPIINRTNIKINAAISSCVRGPIQIVGGNFTGAVVRHIYWNAPNDDASLGLYGCNLVGYYLFPTNPSLDLEAGHVRVINCKFGQNVITTINKTGEVKLVTFGNRNQIAADTNECLGNMIIQDGGYLGLGTSNPDAKLDVVATCPPSSPTFYGSGYNNGNAFGAYTGSKANAPVSYKVQIETVYEGNITSVADAGDGKVTITSTGHGLSNGNEITITGTTNYDGIFVISNTTTNTFEIEALFTITKSGSWEKTNTFKWSDTNGSTWNETGKAITTQVQALNNGISFCFATKTGHIASDYWYFVADVINPLQLNDNENTSLMIVKNNGNVGVGTSSPNEKIEVYGSSPAIRISGAGANDEPALDFYKAGGRTGRIQSYASNLCLYAGDTGNGDIKFFDKMPATSSLLMIIKAGGSVGIGTTSPDASALLQVDSTTKGFLPPRMTTGQRDAISNPIEGLVIYNTSTHKLQFHNGTNWGDV
ncbi:MAG: hypothetical protein JNL74_20280, partial [Fibrobacteres bacterium]|nr:hypothetical protein [Fibrobacterota bacterium]